MYALIQKTDNKILKFSNEYYTLSPNKPFVWIECPDECDLYNWIYDGENFTKTPTEEQLIENSPNQLEENNQMINKQLRASAYREESDPLFFKAQRGEATMEEWLDKVNEIKQRWS